MAKKKDEPNYDWNKTIDKLFEMNTNQNTDVTIHPAYKIDDKVICSRFPEQQQTIVDINVANKTDIYRLYPSNFWVSEKELELDVPKFHPGDKVQIEGCCGDPLEVVSYKGAGKYAVHLIPADIDEKEMTLCDEYIVGVPKSIIDDIFHYCESQAIYDKLSSYGDFYYELKQIVNAES